MATPNDTAIAILLTQGKFALISVEDADLANLKWHLHKGKDDNCYCRLNERGNRVYLHRVILSRILGRELSRHELVDHEDRDGLNNQRYNLRLANGQHNQANAKTPKSNTSGYKGVHRTGNYWQATIHLDYGGKYLGSYLTPEDAAIVYNHAALEHFGEFALFNDIPGWRDIHPIRKDKRAGRKIPK